MIGRPRPKPKPKTLIFLIPRSYLKNNINLLCGCIKNITLA